MSDSTKFFWGVLGMVATFMVCMVLITGWIMLTRPGVPPEIAQITSPEVEARLDAKDYSHHKWGEATSQVYPRLKYTCIAWHQGAYEEACWLGRDRMMEYRHPNAADYFANAAYMRCVSTSDKLESYFEKLCCSEYVRCK